MPSHLRRYDEPGHTHFWTFSCYRRLQFFQDDGVKDVVIEALPTLQATIVVTPPFAIAKDGPAPLPSRGRLGYT